MLLYVDHTPRHGSVERYALRIVGRASSPSLEVLRLSRGGTVSDSRRYPLPSLGADRILGRLEVPVGSIPHVGG